MFVLTKIKISLSLSVLKYIKIYNVLYVEVGEKKTVMAVTEGEHLARF